MSSNSIKGVVTPKAVVIGHLSIGGGGRLPYYDGDYTVTPKVYEQILETQDKSMSDNVTVEAVPYSEVSNPQGGYTVNIAYIP